MEKWWWIRRKVRSFYLIILGVSQTFLATSICLQHMQLGLVQGCLKRIYLLFPVQQGNTLVDKEDWLSSVSTLCFKQSYIWVEMAQLARKWG